MLVVRKHNRLGNCAVLGGNQQRQAQHIPQHISNSEWSGGEPEEEQQLLERKGSCSVLICVVVEVYKVDKHLHRWGGSTRAAAISLHIL